MGLVCGWLDAGLDTAASTSLGEAMARACRLSVLPSSPFDRGQLSVHSTVTPACLADDNGVFAAIEGRPRWLDREHRQIAESQSAAHALIQSYREHGARCLERIHGAFAAAVVVPARRDVLIAIDRSGICEMKYAVLDGGIVFASRADAVAAHPGVGREIRSQGILDYIYFHMVPSPASIYARVRKLGPAECLHYTDGRTRLYRYWEPSFVDGGRAAFGALRAEMHERMREAVATCSPEHAPASGCFLSGGLDSSTVCGVMAGLKPEPVPAYSMGFSADGYDEMAYSRIAAQRFALDHREYYVTPEDVAEAIPRVADAYDEPFGNSSAVPTLLCAELAVRDGIRLMLAGDGGDEIFAGNARYAKQKVFEFYTRIPAAARRRLIEPLLLHSPVGGFGWPLRKLRSYIDQARIPMPARTETYNFLHRERLSEVFEADFLASVDPAGPDRMLGEVYARAPSNDLLHRMLYLDWKFTLADNDLRKVSRMCELAGVEVAYPMLDDRLVEFSTRIPPRLKLRGMQLRYFYKEAHRGFLPDEIIAKKKHGFGLPFGEWLKTSPALQERIYGRLGELAGRGIVAGAFIDDLIQTHRTGHAAYYGTTVWILAMLEEWLRAHRATL